MATARGYIAQQVHIYIYIYIYIIIYTYTRYTCTHSKHLPVYWLGTGPGRSETSSRSRYSTNLLGSNVLVRLVNSAPLVYGCARTSGACAVYIGHRSCDCAVLHDYGQQGQLYSCAVSFPDGRTAKLSVL